ncbi:MAG: four helix bundle protein [Prevotellaceae bacterium]|jgi:four helix bundle protein|nr:four helix bundle protein [Prevotellaceae bacterium]
MGKYLHFEDLEIWKEAMRICKEVYFLFKECRDYGLKDQIQRSAVSIPSNIAEGYERKTIKDTTHFLYIAKGSCGEMRTQLYLSIALELIDKKKGLELIEQSKSLSVKIYNFIQSINKDVDKN